MNGEAHMFERVRLCTSSVSVHAEVRPILVLEVWDGKPTYRK